MQAIMAAVPVDILAHISSHLSYLNEAWAKEAVEYSSISHDNGLVVVWVCLGGPLNQWRLLYHSEEGVCYGIEAIVYDNGFPKTEEVWRKVPKT